MEDVNMRRAEVLAALGVYDSCVRDRGFTEKQVNDIFLSIEEMVPHARISDLFFHGEKERTKEEIVDEALYRERLWQEGGDLAVILHIHCQLTNVIEDLATSEIDRDFASRGLDYINAEIESIRNSGDTIPN